MEQMHSPVTTIPVIGYHMGAVILAEAGDFSRFDSPDKLLAYAGISPSTYQSGQLKTAMPAWRSEVHDIFAMSSSTLPSLSAMGIRPLLLFL